jgi:hypothetical protein
MTIEILDLDTLLAASMDDLEDLPPFGIPPSGHYNFTMSFDIKEIGEDKRQIPVVEYVIDAVNQLKDEDEAGDVAVGQKFQEAFFLAKKDGTKNSMGIGKLKQRLAPFAERFGTTNIGELIQQVKQVAVSGELKRKPNPKDEDKPNMDIKNIVLF